MPVDVSHDACLAVVLSTAHRTIDAYRDADRRRLEALAAAARSLQGLSVVDARGMANTEMRGALMDLRQLQQSCITGAMGKEVVAIMTQWPIPEGILAWEERRHAANVRSMLAAKINSTPVGPSTAWCSAFTRARHALASPSR